MCFRLSVKLDVEQTVARPRAEAENPGKFPQFCAVHRPIGRDSQPHLVRK
jgi:hypothetical protein